MDRVTDVLWKNSEPLLKSSASLRDLAYSLQGIYSTQFCLHVSFAWRRQMFCVYQDDKRGECKFCGPLENKGEGVKNDDVWSQLTMTGWNLGEKIEITEIWVLWVVFSPWIHK